MPTPVVIPLLNANEPEALLAALHVQEGEQVSQGDPLCTLETTKATAELQAETDGYVVGLHRLAGSVVRAGAILCYLASSPDWSPPEASQEEGAPAFSSGTALPEGLRITRPALALAQQHGLDLSGLPIGPLVTETLVQQQLAEAGQKTSIESYSPAGMAFDPTGILVYGGGGHGKMIIDLLRGLGTYRIVGVLDDGLQPGQTVMGVPVLGGGDQLPELHGQGLRLAANAVGGIGNIAVRIKVFHRLADAGFTFPVLVHRTAVIEPSASLAPGSQVLAQAYVGSDVRVGFGSIINTGAIVSHDCQLGSYVNISPGAMLAGEVQVHDGALVGMGVTVNLGVVVGEGARIGNGATVKADVPASGIVRAGAIWPA